MIDKLGRDIRRDEDSKPDDVDRADAAIGVALVNEESPAEIIAKVRTAQGYLSEATATATEPLKAKAAGARN